MWTCACTGFASLIIVNVHVIGAKYLWSNSRHEQTVFYERRTTTIQKGKKKKWTVQMMFYISTTEKSCVVVVFGFFFSFFHSLDSFFCISSIQTSFFICMFSSTNTKMSEHTKRYLMKQHTSDVTTYSFFFSPQNETASENVKEKVK